MGCRRIGVGTVASIDKATWLRPLLNGAIAALGGKAGYVGFVGSTDGGRKLEIVDRIGAVEADASDAGPCARVLAGKPVVVGSGARKKFPKSLLLGKTKAGSYLGHPLRNRKGKVVGLLAVLGPAIKGDLRRRAVTLAHLATLAESLIAEEAERIQLAAVIDALPMLVEIRDRRLHLTFTNSAKSDEGFAELSPAQAEELEALDLTVLETGEASPFFELRKVDATGRESSWWTAKCPLFGAAGERLGILTVAVEVTEFHNARREVEETQKLLRSVIDAIPAAIAVRDSGGRFVVANAMLGDLMAESEGDDRTDPGSDMLNKLDRRAIASGEATGFVEYRSRGPGGAERHWLIDKIPFIDSNNKIDKILTVAVDVSDRKAAEAVIAEERERAVSASRAKSEFLANMSHELRTPLNAVIGYSEIIAERLFGPVSEKYFEYARDIKDSAQHLLNLINDVLDMSRIEAGRQVLSKETTDLGELVRQCQRMMRGRMQDKSLDCRTAIGPGLGSVRIDPRAIKQVLINLLSNAVKFTPDDGRIDIAAAIDGERGIEVSVRDNGIGMTTEEQKHLFETFWQGSSPMVRRQAGSGLGLMISRRLVELHGGSLEIESEAGKGTRAVMRLPPACLAA